MSSSFYNLQPLDHNQEPYTFDQLEGKVVLIVNVSLRGAQARQFKQLQALYDRFGTKGLEILAFPCDQFNTDDPDTIEDFITECKLTYKVTFPIMNKIKVNGMDEDPVFMWLKLIKLNAYGGHRIVGDFEKFLVSGEGKVILRYHPVFTPSHISKAIEKSLTKNFFKPRS